MSYSQAAHRAALLYVASSSTLVIVHYIELDGVTTPKPIRGDQVGLHITRTKLLNF
jgi:hypothetical protein